MTPCPSDDVLGALVQQVLSAEESERVRLHLDECDVCTRSVIAAVRGGAIDTGASPTLAFEGTPIVETGILDSAAIGTKIGRYDVRALIGAGGMGHVYEAYDAELERAIALKVLRPQLALAETLTERLVRESRLMAKISHPSVITVYDVGRAGASVFIAMELIRGETLGAYVARVKRPWRDVLALFEKAGAGLAAAHRAGIVHRDFKPENALVELDGDIAARVVVTDFGIARGGAIAEDLERGVSGRRSDPRITSTGGMVGTPAYMAPEQIVGTAVDLRADVFAFSVSLWEALFGVRPFRGDTIDEIRAAMQRPPQRPAKHEVPRGVIRALERGLATDPAERWQDMTAFVRELSILRKRRRRVEMAAGVFGLVAAGIGGALFLATPQQADPCARATLDFDGGGLRASITDAGVRDLVVGKIDEAAKAWRKVHAATCNADRHPVQSPTTTACLDARKLELLAVVDDLIADRGRDAAKIAGTMGDPERCVSPAPGHLIASVPQDRALRRKVTALRYRGFAIEAARDRGDYKTGEAAQLVTDAEATWPFVHAEALYALGMTQSYARDAKAAMKTLKRAATVAETIHHDFMATAAWTQLVIVASFDAGLTERGLEYATYAEAALARLGRPPLETALFEYAKGNNLALLGRFDEAESMLRHAVELSTEHRLSTLPSILESLGHSYQSQGRYQDAVDAYRTALAKLGSITPASVSKQVMYRQQLALNLNLLGKTEEAERLAREALDLTDQLPAAAAARTDAYVVLAQVLAGEGRFEDALVEIRRAIAGTQRGERSEQVGAFRQTEGDYLSLLGRHVQAAASYKLGCEAVLASSGEGPDHALCELAYATALQEGNQLSHALHVLDGAVPVLLASFEEPHAEIGNALLTRGTVRHATGNTAGAIADLERAVTNFTALAVDRGYLGAAKLALAKALWERDRSRAAGALDEALAAFDQASEPWAEQRQGAKAWAASHRKR